MLISLRARGCARVSASERFFLQSELVNKRSNTRLEARLAVTRNPEKEKGKARDTTVILVDKMTTEGQASVEGTKNGIKAKHFPPGYR